MADYVQRYADKQSDILTKKIGKVYGQAAKEIKEKLDSFRKAHEAIEKKMLRDLKDGKITKKDYKDWLRNQVFQEERWKNKMDEITKVYLNADKKARELVGDADRSVFIEAGNWQAYRTGIDVNGAVSFDMYDRKTVDRLLKDNPQMLPEWKINEKKDYIWNYNRVNNAVTQGIIQGESVYDIGKRLYKDLSASNASKMDMFARTAVTGAQNAGRIERLHEAEEMGIKVKKRWLAARDNRVRDAHAELDGVEVDVDEPFHNEFGAIDYPGDPTADPANTYNCRCTLIYVYPEYKDKHHFEEHQTYAEWKEEQQNTTDNKKSDRRTEETKEKEENNLEDLFGDLWSGKEDQFVNYIPEKQEENNIDDSYGQFGIKESTYPKNLQYTKTEQEYINGMDKFWHDEKNVPKGFDFNEEVSMAISGRLPPTEETFKHLEEAKEQYKQKIKNAEEVIAERKESGYKGASRSENWQKWQTLKRELRGADEFEVGQYLKEARVGEKGIRYWQIEKKEAENKIKQIELAEKVLKRKKYALGVK